MALTKLQFEDSPELIEKKKVLYQHAMLQIYARILTKRDIIRELGFALEKIGVPTERIASTIATELIHPEVFPEGSMAETKNSKGGREDISGRPNPESGKSMVHPDYARRNLPEFMKNYSQWRSKEKLDEQMKKKMEAGHTTKGKKINYVRSKKASIVDYEHEVKKKIAEMEEAESDKKKDHDSGSTQKSQKEEHGHQTNSTSIKEPSDNTAATKRKRVKSKKAVEPHVETPAVPMEVGEELQDDELAKVVVDNKLLPSLQTDENAERAKILETDNMQLQSNLTKLTEMYDQLFAAYKAVTTPFKERKWVSVTVKGVDYIVGVSYKCDPTTRRIYHKEFQNETTMLLPDEYKTDYNNWKIYTNKRMSVDLISESPQSASTGST